MQNFDKYLSPFVDVYAYCLMPNHFHFLIKIKELQTSEVSDHQTSEVSDHQTSEVLKTSEVLLQKTSEVLNTSGVLQQRGSKKLTAIEKAFKDFFISYAKGINKAYNRTGSLFQAKFKKKEISDDGYFTTIIQYIHANPVKAKLCSTYQEYKYSSYKAMIDTGNTKIKRAEVLEWFGNRAIFIKVHEERKLEMEMIEKFIFS